MSKSKEFLSSYTNCWGEEEISASASVFNDSLKIKSWS